MVFVIKVVSIFVITLGSSLLVYPLVHETGHVIASLIMRYEVVNHGFYPMPYLTIEHNNSLAGVIFVAISGIAFPVIIYLIVPRVHFVPWLVSTVCISVNAVMALSSVVSGVAFLCGVTWKDDIVSVLQVYPDALWWYLLAEWVLLSLMVILIAKTKPLMHITRFLYERTYQQCV